MYELFSIKFKINNIFYQPFQIEYFIINCSHIILYSNILNVIKSNMII